MKYNNHFLAYFTNSMTFLGSLGKVAGVLEIVRGVMHDDEKVHAAIGAMIYASGTLLNWGVESIGRTLDAHYKSALEDAIQKLEGNTRWD